MPNRAELSLEQSVFLGLIRNCPSEKVQRLNELSRPMLSLDMKVGEEEDSTLGDFIASSEPPVEEVANEQLLREQIRSMLDELRPREQRIVKLRFGLEDGYRYTLEEVASKFGLTRERIRQIEAAALRKLRHPSRSRKLKAYFENDSNCA